MICPYLTNAAGGDSKRPNHCSKCICCNDSALQRRSCARNKILKFLCSIFCLLEWVFDHIIFPKPYLLLFFCHLMLHEHLFRIVFQEFPDKPWIPKFACDAQIFAAAHHCIGLAPLGSGRNAVGVEVCLFTPGDGDKSGREHMLASMLKRDEESRDCRPSQCYQRILPCDGCRRNNRLSPRSQTPCSRPECLV